MDLPGTNAKRDTSGLASRIQQYYEKWWENPRDIRNPIFNRLNDLVQNRIERAAGVGALDLGSGKGRVVSMLLGKGWKVTAVELSPVFARELKTKFPSATVVCGDVRNWGIHSNYDLVTCIELTQVLPPDDLRGLLIRVRPYAKRVLINISNRQSIHGVWVRIRRFQAPFIVTYRPRDLVRMLETTGYHVVFTSGVGFLTPISLLRNFKVRLMTPGIVDRFRKLDNCFPEFCHLYLAEAVPIPEAEE